MSEIRVDTISEKTSANGVAIDSVTLKDGGATLADNITFNASGKGVHLGVTSATSSNLLDDYEEGTWTPTISNVTFGTDGNVGGYTKVGRHVTIAFYLDIDSGTFDSTQLQIGGLPFANGTRECIGTIMYNQLDHGTDYQIMPYLNSGQSIIRLYQSKDATGWGALATNSLSSSTAMFITLNYQT